MRLPWRGDEGEGDFVQRYGHFARRVAAFADKHKIVWAGHGHDNTSDPEQFAKPETLS